jgi:hypothetical protein
MTACGLDSSSLENRRILCTKASKPVLPLVSTLSGVALPPEHSVRPSGAAKLAPKPADETLGVGVRPWGSDWHADDLDPFAAEHLVEATGELRVPIVDEEAPRTLRIVRRPAARVLVALALDDC